MKYERSAGILLHPTSLPGPYGIGDIGPSALKWVDFLYQAGFSLWQVLPLGPTGYGDSPYQCFSAFAGNPYLISPEALVQDGLLRKQDIEDHPEFPSKSVEYGPVIEWKLTILNNAFQQYQGEAGRLYRKPFEQFRSENADWLNDYALFMALKEYHAGASWSSWDNSLRLRDKEELNKATRVLADAVERQAFWQFLFFMQWERVRSSAHRNGIKIIGDLPIFVAQDSADVWAHPELFHLDVRSLPKYQAGVPPDYYSLTGQLWGNPLYRWRQHRADGYAWWKGRVQSTLNLVDMIRLDHFRGFAGYWQVSGKAKTAENGRWVKAPGKDFLQSMKNTLGDLPFIAEDLGVITPDVNDLRDHFNLPGMKVILFAFGGEPNDTFLPHNYPVHCVAYTGTHDNDTTLGWYSRVEERERAFFRRYMGRDGSRVSWDMIRAVWASVAVFALAPMQDFLALGNEARMNYPGNPSGNWSWRMNQEDLSIDLQEQMREINFLYDRSNPNALK